AECHMRITPGIVVDWQLSKHSANDVGCSACHGDGHNSMTDVAKAGIARPEVCANCHALQVEQFGKGKHALAWGSMKAMPTLHWQPMALAEGLQGCGSCHRVGLKTEGEVKDLIEKGSGFGASSCDACHTRHLFSVDEARSPQACRTCHMGVDHPQWEMYSASKHGVRFLLNRAECSRKMPPPPPARAVISRTATMLTGLPGDILLCVCLILKTTNGQGTEPPYCKPSESSTPRESQLR